MQTNVNMRPDACVDDKMPETTPKIWSKQNSQVASAANLLNLIWGVFEIRFDSRPGFPREGWASGKRSKFTF